MIGTGYNQKSDWDISFAELWYRNQREHCPFQKRIAVISTGYGFPVAAEEINVFYGKNLGHVGDGPKELCGWSAGFLALCLLAYNNQEDLIYREQDVLAFGPWIETAYADLGDGDMIFGPRMQTAPWMCCAQSIVIIRHRFLLTFVKRYLALGNDTLQFLPEHKFCALKAQEPKRFRELSFGVDRMRPLPFHAPVWYAQQFTKAELDDMKALHLI
jgi:hypothetical protein